MVARKRLLNPIEFPVLGAVGLGVLIFSFSRVMLAVDKQIGTALFIVIAALLLVGGVLFAVRTTLQRSIVSAICVIAEIGIVSAQQESHLCSWPMSRRNTSSSRC